MGTAACLVEAIGRVAAEVIFSGRIPQFEAIVAHRPHNGRNEHVLDRSLSAGRPQSPTALLALGSSCKLHLTHRQTRLRNTFLLRAGDLACADEKAQVAWSFSVEADVATPSPIVLAMHGSLATRP